MFGTEGRESEKNQIVIEHFDEWTVCGFLEYLYAETLRKGAKSTLDREKL